MSFIDTSKADVVDTSHVDAALASARRNEETARRRAMVLTWAKAVFWGGVGIGAVCLGASFLIQPKVIETTKVVEVPKVIETTKVVEVPKIIEVTAGAKVEPPPVKVADAPRPPLPVQRKWNQLNDKTFKGILTDIGGDHVCFNHNQNDCTWVAVMDGNRHAVLTPDGRVVIDHDEDAEPMRKWIGLSVYTAVDPDDPAHLTDYWVADNGVLTKFQWDKKHAAYDPCLDANTGSHCKVENSAADRVTLHSDDDGHSLTLDVGIGQQTYLFLLDTGATDMTVTADVADQLIAAGHARLHGEEPVILADGSKHTERTITIDAVTVGTHTVRNVHASVAPSGAPMLLGMDVLNRIGTFTIDAPNRTLTFHGAA
jgi:clan AA aspartic protease (TIGR02281 family)